MSARTALRQVLIDNVASVQGRVFEMSTAQPTTTFPFLVVKGSSETPGEAWGNVAQPFEVWPYVQPVTVLSGLTPYNSLDALVAEIEAALGGRFGYWYAEGGVPYVATWTGGAGQDFQDDAWQSAHTRPQTVSVASLAWLNLQHTVLDGLRAWTLATFPTWVVDPGGTPPTDAAPWIFWRFVALPSPGEALTFDYSWMNCTAAAHVVCPTAMARASVSAQLAEELSRGAFAPSTFPLANGSNGQILMVRGNPDLDPKVQGQVQVDVRYAFDDSYPDDDGSGPLKTAVIYGPPTRTSVAP